MPDGWRSRSGGRRAAAFALAGVWPAYAEALLRESGPVEPLHVGLFIPTSLPLYLAALFFAAAQLIDVDGEKLARLRGILPFRVEEPLELLGALGLTLALLEKYARDRRRAGPAWGSTSAAGVIAEFARGGGAPRGSGGCPTTPGGATGPGWRRPPRAGS